MRPRAARGARLLVLAATVWCLFAGSSEAEPRKDMTANAGIIGMAITNLGYVGNGFTIPTQPSGEYPLNSNVEHLFMGGIWVGARMSDGTVRVSTGAQDVSNLAAGDEIREFVDSDDPVLVWSNTQNSDNYNPGALATQHIECSFDDYAVIESGNHTPLGVKVILRALAWGSPYADDFIILDYRVVNISGSELSDVYIGYWNDTTVGNTTVNNPYDSSSGQGWNYYDDVNGGWRPGDVEGDPDIWMIYERDADGDDEMATSWIATRLLGTGTPVAPAEGMPPVSYNSWRFRDLPGTDDETFDPDEGQTLPGKYQLLGNGHFDVDEPNTQEPVFSVPSDWMGLLSTGPFPYLAPGDTLQVTFAVVCGADSLAVLENSKVAQVAYDSGFSIPEGPPSPRLVLEYDDDTAILAWAPGDSTEIVDGEPRTLGPDDPRRSPEHHVSIITGRYDFQGYRVYRYLGDTFTDDPNEQSTLVAQFDKIDGIGFDTGLPPLGADGLRRFTDTSLLDGFPYWYSVVSFSAPDLDAGLPEFRSGFNENAVLLFPGPAPDADGADGGGIGVFPNPYRAASLFDGGASERELGRKIWFTGLPPRASVQIFSLAGDLVEELQHDDPYSGMTSWDMLSGPGRAIASGLYVYVVEDLASGEIQRGKLVIIK
jgi:hypothetical protein